MQYPGMLSLFSLLYVTPLFHRDDVIFNSLLTEIPKILPENFPNEHNLSWVVVLQRPCRLWFCFRLSVDSEPANKEVRSKERGT